MSVKTFIVWLTVTMILAFSVITLGAYTRLTHAGLGCPDWPGCYGQWLAPSSSAQITQIQTEYPDQQIDGGKAWTEMVHRYAAGGLGLLIIGLTGFSLIYRRRENLPIGVPLVLVGLIIWQALLGMWTVTLKLHPLIVMAHLLGGLTIFAGLAGWRAQLVQLAHPITDYFFSSRTCRWVGLGLLLLIGQIALGGWVSANYAGIACLGFPTCNGHWWPMWHWQAFDIFMPLGMNYEGGLLGPAERVSIQMAHRIGAFLVVGYWGVLAIYLLIQSPPPRIRTPLILLMLLLVAQFVIGMINVLALLPLSAATAHNGVAALILVTAVNLYLQVRSASNR
ncbi:MAG: heme A synthase [Legionellales bacterium]|nr:heme A synthase [Legionellales bacterium]